MDFVVDGLFNGHRFRALTIVNNYSRECLAIETGQSMTGSEVAAVIGRLVKERGAPDRIQCDNGTEFISRVLDKWAYEHGVTGWYIERGQANLALLLLTVTTQFLLRGA
jgi:putative transposase